MKKMFSIMLAFILVFSLAGCGNSSKSVEAEKEPISTEKVEAVETESTENTESAEQPAEEKIAVEKTEETEVAKEPVEEPAKEAQETEKPEETEVTEEKQYVVDKYIADGDFKDYGDYGMEMGATKITPSARDWNIYIVFDGYYVTIGTDTQDAENSYVGVGPLDANGSFKSGDLTYTYPIRHLGEPLVPVYDTANVPIAAVYALEDLIVYMKDHPDPNVKPEIEGANYMTWDEMIHGG